MRKYILIAAIVALIMLLSAATMRPEETDAECLAKMMWGECRGVSSTAEKAAVAWCALNRVDSSVYPDTIKGVVKQPYQFHGYSESNPVDPELLSIAEDVIARWQAEKSCIGSVGRVLPKEYTYFYGDGLKNHFFCVVGGVRQKWSFGGYDPYTGIEGVSP